MKDKYILILLLLWFILPLTTVFLISKLILPIYHAKYLIGATPPLFLLSAKGIEQLKKSSWAFYLVGGLIILAMVTKLYPYYRYSQKEPWRNFVNYIGKNWEESDTVIIYPGWATTTFNYYAKGRYPIYRISTQVGDNVLDMDKRYWLICYDCDNQEQKRLIDHINIKDNFHKVAQFQHMALYRSMSN